MFILLPCVVLLRQGGLLRLVTSHARHTIALGAFFWYLDQSLVVEASVLQVRYLIRQLEHVLICDFDDLLWRLVSLPSITLVCTRLSKLFASTS